MSVAVVVTLLFTFAIVNVGTGATPVAARPGACQELIVNGGFEDGHTGWTQSSKLQFELLDTFYPYTGAVGAWLGAANNAEDDLTQTVTLPSGAAGLTLRYWWAVVSEEAPGGSFDTARSELLRANGSVITTTLMINNDSAEAWVWNEAVADLSAYAGQTVELRLKAVNDATNPTSFFYDDVSLLACANEGTTTPTPTGTHSPTATPRSRLFLPLILRQ